MIASSFVGVFTDNVETKYIRHIYWIGVPLAIQVVFPLLRGYMPEDYYPPAERRILKEKFNSERNLFYLAFSMAFFALGMAFVNLFGSSTQILVYAILSSLFLSFLGFM